MAADGGRRNKISRIKKLALAYKTGWEYTPEGEEAGSVLTDVLLDMLGENEKRLAGKWKKHYREFLRIVPGGKNRMLPARLGVSVRTSHKAGGALLPAGTKFYLTSPEGRLFWFRLDQGVRLTEAKLRYVVYQKALSAWLIYRFDGEEPGGEIRAFERSTECLARPCFRRSFRGLCDGLEKVCFRPEFSGTASGEALLKGISRKGFMISDGRVSYPLTLEVREGVLLLLGDTPEFKKNLLGGLYELRLDIPPGEEAVSCPEMLWGRMTLKQEPGSSPAGLCITEDELGDFSEVRPFGREPEPSGCCYIACDAAMTPRNERIALSFRQECEVEERLPPERTGDRRLYKKYPWLLQEQKAEEWKGEGFFWEYYNGICWRGLSEYEQGGEEAASKEGLFLPENSGKSCFFIWRRPEDMSPCIMEGQEHYFIRLRPRRVEGAYARYYRKYIPVMKNITFSTEEICFDSLGEELPEREELGRERLYFGFDGEIAAENTWFIRYRMGEEEKKASFSFREDMLFGKRTLYGLKGCWAAMERESFFAMLNDKERDGEEAGTASPVITRLWANYAEGTGIPEEEQDGQGTGSVLIPKGSGGYIKTKEWGQLALSSLWDSVLGGGDSGAGVPGREDFYPGFGRIASWQDLKELVRRLAPEFEVLSCDLSKDRNRLEVRVKPVCPPEEAFSGEASGKEGRIEVIQRQLEGIIRDRGGIWISEVSVRLLVEDAGGKGEEHGED